MNWVFAKTKYSYPDIWIILVFSLGNSPHNTCANSRHSVMCHWQHSDNLSPHSTKYHVTWCFSDRASRINYILITNLMRWLLFIHKTLFSSTCFEPQVLSSGGYSCIHAAYGTVTLFESSWWPVGTQYHMLNVYNCILLKMSTWGSKHVDENSILWINNNQFIKLVTNI